MGGVVNSAQKKEKAKKSGRVAVGPKRWRKQLSLDPLVWLVMFDWYVWVMVMSKLSLIWIDKAELTRKSRLGQTHSRVSWHYEFQTFTNTLRLWWFSHHPACLSCCMMLQTCPDHFGTFDPISIGAIPRVKSIELLKVHGNFWIGSASGISRQDCPDDSSEGPHGGPLPLHHA